MSDRLADLLIWPLLDVSFRWGGLIVVLAAWFAIRRPRLAATRHALCVAALLTGPALWLAPRWDVYVYGPPPTVGADFGPTPSPGVVRVHSVAPTATPPNVAPVAVAPRPRAEPPRAPIDWPRMVARIVVLAWLAGTLLMLARLAMSVLALRRWVRAATPATADDRALLDACRAIRPTSRPARVARHPKAASPVLVGGFRPTIMLPADWDAWPADRRRAAMLHELAHVRRYDDASKFLGELLRVPTWFHPAVVWLLARLGRERELLCDEAVVAAGDDPKSLARLLLDLSRGPSPRRLPSASLPFLLDRRATAVRIQRLLEDDMPRTLSRPSLARSLALGSAALTALLTLGALRVRPASAWDAPAPAPAPSQSPAPIEGVVVDADGKPIPGATVVVDGGAEYARRVLTADAEGRFSAPGSTGERWISVIAAAPGWVPIDRSHAPDSPDRKVAREPLVLKLPRPAPFAATLVDEADRPLAGATVRVTKSAYEEPTPGVKDSKTTTIVDVPRREMVGTPIERHMTATTAEDGSFSLPDAVRAGVAIRVEITTRDGRRRIVSHPPPGLHGWTLEEDGFLVPKPGEALRVKTLPPARIEGHVVSGVAGVDLSSLKAWYQASEPGPGPTPTTANSRAEAPVDAEGRFAFDNLDSGAVNVFVSGAGEAESWTYRAASNLTLTPGRDAAATIELIEGVEVSGLVMTADKRPIPGARVAVYGPFRPRSAAATLDHATDADGRYRFRLPAGETYFYIFSLPGEDARGGDRGHRAVTIPEGATHFEVPTLIAPGGPRAAPPAVKKAPGAR